LLAFKLEYGRALIERGACEVAIVDSNLAGVGADLPAAIALTASGLPFIVLSGYSRDQIKRLCRGAPSSKAVPAGAAH
jgi:hypothetical protein